MSKPGETTDSAQQLYQAPESIQTAGRTDRNYNCIFTSCTVPDAADTQRYFYTTTC